MPGKNIRSVSGKMGVGMSAPGRPGGKAIVPVQRPGVSLKAASVKPPKGMAPVTMAPKAKKAY